VLLFYTGFNGKIKDNNTITASSSSITRQPNYYRLQIYVCQVSSMIEENLVVVI